MVKPVQVLVEAYAGTKQSQTWPPPHSSGTPRHDCPGFVESHRSVSGADDRNPELPGATVHDFAEAAGNAIGAGFDGVEVHGANGYLVHQFLSAATNLRSDKWGGAIQNRSRFAVEVVRAVADTIGTHCTALRISSGNPSTTWQNPTPWPPTLPSSSSFAD